MRTLFVLCALPEGWVHPLQDQLETIASCEATTTASVGVAASLISESRVNRCLYQQVGKV